MEVNADEVVNELLEQIKNANYQSTVAKVALHQAHNRVTQLEQENALLRGHIMAFENAAKAAKTEETTPDSED